MTSTDLVDVINDNLIDIHKLAFNDSFKNLVFSTHPLLPRFHATFGEPLNRLEISQERQAQKTQDNKKEEGKRLLGRVDTIEWNEQTGFYFVKDDFGKYIMYDAAMLDMKKMDEEMLKMVSYYINK